MRLQAVSTTKQSRLRIWNTSDFPSPTCQRKQKEITTLWHNRRNLMELGRLAKATCHESCDPLRSMGSMRSGATGALTASHGSQMTAILHQEARRHHFAEGAKMGPHRRPGSGGQKGASWRSQRLLHLLIGKLVKSEENYSKPSHALQGRQGMKSQEVQQLVFDQAVLFWGRNQKVKSQQQIDQSWNVLSKPDTRNVWKINALWELG